MVKEKGEEGKEVDLMFAFSGMVEEVIDELCFGEAFKSERTEQIRSRICFKKATANEIQVPRKRPKASGDDQEHSNGTSCPG